MHLNQTENALLSLRTLSSPKYQECLILLKKYYAAVPRGRTSLLFCLRCPYSVLSTLYENVLRLSASRSLTGGWLMSMESICSKDTQGLSLNISERSQIQGSMKQKLGLFCFLLKSKSLCEGLACEKKSLYAEVLYKRGGYERRSAICFYLCRTCTKNVSEVSETLEI